MDRRFKELKENIQATDTDLKGKLDTKYAELKGNIEATDVDLKGKINSTYAVLKQKIDAGDTELEEKMKLTGYSGILEGMSSRLEEHGYNSVHGCCS